MAAADPATDDLAGGETRMHWGADADPFASLGPVDDPEDRG
jgi:hypothetical protein